MQINFPASELSDLKISLSREWLETNGVGGWASGTVAGANTRKYHGLLVAAIHPPLGRNVLVSKMDETVVTGTGSYDLSCNLFPGTVSPKGYRHLKKYSQDFFPGFEYEAGGVLLKKTIAAIHGENTTVILYEVLKAPAIFTLELKLLSAFRDYHANGKEHSAFSEKASFRHHTLSIKPSDSLPRVHIHVPESGFEFDPGWNNNFEYPIEAERGMDSHEDLFSHGKFMVDLEEGSTLGIILSTEPIAGRSAGELLKLEEIRRKNLIVKTGGNELLQQLTLAADQFIVERSKDLKTVLAGYHWFSDWGRDTMIALPGLCLCTHRFDDAKKILKAFAEATYKGLLPNRFSDIPGEVEYNTVDASMWYFDAANLYMSASGDVTFIQNEIYPVLKDIIKHHLEGTLYNIHCEEDGLLYAGEPGVQLTWMDAKCGSYVVTPRDGKAVEINALWYNALLITAEMAYQFGEKDEADRLKTLAEKTGNSFRKTFYHHEGGYLYDYVKGKASNTDFRPNQVIAIAITHSPVDDEMALSILKQTEEKLLTPVGLRSLAPGHTHYRPYYTGDGFSRDTAYHQGTVWAWLLGPYYRAKMKLEGEKGKKAVIDHVENLARVHLAEAGIGSISEIFDAEAPFMPKGTIAQAWSVSEVLRGYKEALGMK